MRLSRRKNGKVICLYSDPPNPLFNFLLSAHASGHLELCSICKIEGFRKSNRESNIKTFIYPKMKFYTIMQRLQQATTFSIAIKSPATAFSITSNPKSLYFPFIAALHKLTQIFQCTHMDIADVCSWLSCLFGDTFQRTAGKIIGQNHIALFL